MGERVNQGEVLQCAVIGGGTMGAGIAHALLLAESEVVLIERDDAAVAAAQDRVEAAVAASASRRVIADRSQVMARLIVTTDAARASEASIVVEAVPEDFALKRDTLARIAAIIPAASILATNTSSISVSRLAEGIHSPERVIGLHFFNPVPASKLVEVVRAEQTSPEVVERSETLVRTLGKTPIIVQDVPGFASSRLGVAIGLEAIRMLEDGVATADDIDAAMVLGYGFPMGPLRLTDLVGLDVRLGIARYLANRLGPRFTPPQLLVTMVEQGRLGKKTGTGFFDWTEHK